MNQAKDFIRFFERIPGDRWCKRVYSRGKRRCALGHLGQRIGYPEKGEAHELVLLFGRAGWKPVHDVNDDGLTSARTNILRALREMQREGY